MPNLAFDQNAFEEQQDATNQYLKGDKDSLMRDSELSHMPNLAFDENAFGQLDTKQYLKGDTTKRVYHDYYGCYIQ